MAVVNKDVTVDVNRFPSGITGKNAGYQVSVEPWVVQPDKKVDKLGTIKWDFNAHNGLEFGEITVNFKTKNHFVPPPQKKGSDFVLQDTLPPAANKKIEGDLDGTFLFKSQNYNYILEFTLLYEVVEDGVTVQKEVKVELDPGYRVKP